MDESEKEMDCLEWVLEVIKLIIGMTVNSKHFQVFGSKRSGYKFLLRTGSPIKKQ